MTKEHLVIFIIVLSIFAGLGSWVYTRAADNRPDYVYRDIDSTQRSFDVRGLYAISDLDMVGTSYSNGVLKPISGAFDVLSRVDVAQLRAQSSSERVSNSVTGWPGTLELSPNAKHAYVIETLGAAPKNVDSVKDVYTELDKGTLLTTLAVQENKAPRIVDLREVGPTPFSVHPAPNGRWLVITVRDDTSPFAFVILKDGVPTEVRRPSIALPAVPKPKLSAEQLQAYVGASFARISPDGLTLATHIYSSHVTFGEIVFDADKLPIDVRFGPTLAAGKFISVGRWSLDGRHYVIADTGWGPNGSAMLAGPGQLTSIALDKLNGKIVSSATVSLGPEGMEMNRAGDLFVAVNMERTWSPGPSSKEDAARRLEASLSLVSFNAVTGSLHTVDGPIAFKSVLPEDAVFDRDGDMLAVATFNDRVESPQDGWIELFSIDRSKGSPQVFPTGKRISLPRGVHDLAVAY